MRYECKDCGCTLWSQRAKDKGYCPECQRPDEEQVTDLEQALTKEGAKDITGVPYTPPTVR